MNSLTLDESLELYEILGAHIPDIDDADADALEFIGKIINNVSDSDPVAYTFAIELMSEKTLLELQEMDSEERIILFTDGLMQNRILDLKFFCEQLGF